MSNQYPPKNSEAAMCWTITDQARPDIDSYLHAMEAENAAPLIEVSPTPRRLSLREAA